MRIGLLRTNNLLNDGLKIIKKVQIQITGIIDKFV